MYVPHYHLVPSRHIFTVKELNVIVKNSPFAKELVKRVTFLTFADFLFTGPTGGRKPKLR